MKADNIHSIKTYLTITAGLGLSAAADAATTITFYGINSANDTNANPLGISPPFRGPSNWAFGSMSGSNAFFTNFNSDSASSFTGDRRAGYFASSGGNLRGAVAGKDNFVGVSFNGDDGVYEAVAQFFVDTTNLSNGYLIAIATSNPVPNPQNLSAVGGDNLGVAAGRAAIEAVPEPSSLALLALGSTGLLARRNRKKTA